MLNSKAFAIASFEVFKTLLCLAGLAVYVYLVYLWPPMAAISVIVVVLGAYAVHEYKLAKRKLDGEQEQFERDFFG